ncbi:hypothetical protein KR009_011994 [Drosophila setifemur]|nr:hypothetical protein KR009_011994 [Drosophila setifemur]
MHFVTQQRAQNQHQQSNKSNSSSSSSLASSSSCSGSLSATGSAPGSVSASATGSGSGTSRFAVLRKSSSQGALPKSLATAQSLFLRSSSQSKHKRTSSLNAAPM